MNPTDSKYQELVESVENQLREWTVPRSTDTGDAGEQREGFSALANNDNHSRMNHQSTRNGEHLHEDCKQAISRSRRQLKIRQEKMKNLFIRTSISSAPARKSFLDIDTRSTGSCNFRQADASGSRHELSCLSPIQSQASDSYVEDMSRDECADDDDPEQDSLQSISYVQDTNEDLESRSTFANIASVSPRPKKNNILHLLNEAKMNGLSHVKDRWEYLQLCNVKADTFDT